MLTLCVVVLEWFYKEGSGEAMEQLNRACSVKEDAMWRVHLLIFFKGGAHVKGTWWSWWWGVVWFRGWRLVGCVVGVDWP